MGEGVEHAVGVVAHFGDGLREPAVDGAVHQQVAEGEHEGERDEGDEDGSPKHAGAETGAEDAAALVCVELEEVTDEDDEDAYEEEEGDDGEGEKDEGLDGRFGVEDGLVEGVEGAEGEKEDEQAGEKADDPGAPALLRSHEKEFTPGRGRTPLPAYLVSKILVLWEIRGYGTVRSSI